MPPTYDFLCPTCQHKVELTCKQSEKRLKWPQCSNDHGDMEYVYNNTNKHVDHTDTRKGYHNGNEGNHR